MAWASASGIGYSYSLRRTPIVGPLNGETSDIVSYPNSDRRFVTVCQIAMHQMRLRFHIGAPEIIFRLCSSILCFQQVLAAGARCCSCNPVDVCMGQRVGSRSGAGRRTLGPYTTGLSVRSSRSRV